MTPLRSLSRNSMPTADPLSPLATECPAPEDTEQCEYVAAQLAAQLPDDTGPLVLVPVVGFGMQSHAVVPRTVAQLARQRTVEPFTVVLLVNRPRHRADDGTEAIVRKAVQRHAADAPSARFAVARIVVHGRPRVGALRQLMHDAIALTRPLDPDTPVVIADDDLVHVPPGTLERVVRAFCEPPACDAFLGPVLFDDPVRPSVEIVDFFVSDVLRALLAARWVGRLGGVPAGSAATEWWTRHAEAIALSGHLAVRSGALIRADGFPPLNEITGVVQRIQRQASDGAYGTIAGTWDFDPDRPAAVLRGLLDTAVRISSRRAFLSYVDNGAPSVDQWRACRFHASRVDPARVRVPTRRRPESRGTEELVEATASLVAATLRRFPADLHVARDALRALGLDGRCCSVTPPDDEGGTWNVAIHDPQRMFDHVRDARRHLAVRARSLEGGGT